MQNEIIHCLEIQVSKTIEKSRIISTKFRMAAEGVRMEMELEESLNWIPGIQVFFVFLFFLPYTYFINIVLYPIF